MKVKSHNLTMNSPNLFLPSQRTNVFSVETGQWVGYIISDKNNTFEANCFNGTGSTFSDMESAILFLQSAKAKPVSSKIELTDPSQLNLF